MICYYTSDTRPKNAWSQCLSPLGFDLYPMFIVDFLQEIELGVWKAIFSHLIRILYAHDPNMVHELNKRYV